MSLFEWLWERKNPNPTGTINDREKPKRDEPINWLLLIIGQVLFWFLCYQIVELETYGEEGIKLKIVFGIVLLIYAITGYNLDIQPNYDNLGWLGGIVDNPFRYTDDVNRFLIFF